MLASGMEAAAPSEWVVRFSESARGILDAGVVRHPAELLNGPAAQFSVVAGLGLPGQYLVRAEGEPSQLPAALDANPHLLYAAPNAEAEGLATFPSEQSLPDFGKLIGLHNPSSPGGGGDIDAPEAWELTTGDHRVVVGVIDTGIDYTHPDLYRNIWINQGEIPPAKFDPADPAHPNRVQDVDGDGRITFFDLNQPVNAAHVTDANGNGYIDAHDLLTDLTWANGINEDGNRSGEGPLAVEFIDDLVGWDFAGGDNNPFDDHGHGTHVAGIVGAEGDNGLGVVGVNWAVSLLPLKFLDENNRGDTADAIQAVNYARSLRERGENLRVLNNSWESSDGFNPALLDAIEATAGEEMLFVAGAGNGTIFRLPVNNDATPVFPASYDVPNIVSVTATDAEDQLVSFFNFGPASVDLAAPGLSVFSTEPGGEYGFRSGTSFSTAFVSGAAALALTQLPEDVTMLELREMLYRGADPLASLMGKTSIGARLNARRALDTDAYGPRASLVDPQSLKLDVRNQSSVEFEVEYRDDRAVRLASLGNGDVELRRREDNVSILAEFVSASTSADAAVIRALYRVNAPGGVFDPDDNAVYDLLLVDGHVMDAAMPANSARPAAPAPENPLKLGTLMIDVPTPETLIVNSTADSIDANPGDTLAADAQGRATLRAAVMEANATDGPNVIRLPAGVFTLTLAGANENQAATGDLDITDPAGLTIVGQGAGETIIDAAGLDRVLHVLAGSLEVRGVTIRGGDAEADLLAGDILTRTTEGGGIRLDAAESALVVEDSEIAGNSAKDGGGIFQFKLFPGPADPSVGDVIIKGSKIRENHARGAGGGLALAGPALIENSEIRGNMAEVLDGGGLRSYGGLTIVDSIVAENAAGVQSSGGFSSSAGGGVAAHGPHLLIDRTIIENNTALVQGVLRDVFEANDSLFIERFGGDQTIEDLSIHAAEDIDRFRWTAETNGVVTVDALFSHDAGDLDLRVVNLDTQVEVISASADDNEQALVAVSAGDRLEIEVTGTPKKGASRYTLVIDGPGLPPGLQPDAFEADPFPVLMAGDQTIGDLSIHAAFDDDVFLFLPSGSGALTVEIAFSHSEGNLGLAIHDVLGNEIARSDNAEDFERVVVDVSPIATYQIRVFGEGATNPNYTLKIDAPARSTEGGGVYVAPRFVDFILGAPADASLTIRDSTIRGNTADIGGGVFHSAGAGHLEITGAVIAENTARASQANFEDPFTYGGGGGIYTADQLTLSESTISDNQAPVGAGIDVASSSGGPVAISNSLITRNISVQDLYSAGGGLRNGTPALGGRDVLIADTTISDNISRFEGGGVSNAGTMTLSGVTLSGNTAAAGGGASNWGELLADRSTFSGNLATDENEPAILDEDIAVPNGEGGAIYAVFVPELAADFGANYPSPFTAVYNTTITENRANSLGAGIVADATRVVAANSIISRNRLPGIFADNNFQDGATKDRDLAVGEFVSEGHNLLGTAAPSPFDNVFTEPSDLVNQNEPKLGELRDNGGPTLTHAPLAGSPAVDAGRFVQDFSTVDQRGVARPQDGDGNGAAVHDIGAVERLHGEIRGVVFRDANENGVRDVGEPGLENWIVFLDADGDGLLDAEERTAATDARGEYEFTLVLPGQHRVAAIVRELFHPTPPPDAEPFQTITLGIGQAADVNFGFESKIAEIRGQIFNDQDGDGDKDGLETGLEDWTVFLDVNENGQLDNNEPEAVTGVDGRYAFPNLPPGEYRVEQVLKTGWSRTTPVPIDLLNVDFSNPAGDGALEGFTPGVANSQWHLTTGRGGQAGHSADDAVYLGSGEGPAGGGAYRASTDQAGQAGVLISPPIDLTGVAGSIRLEFNHLLDVENIDTARVSVLTDDGEFPLLDNQALGGLANTSGAFKTISLDVTQFAGQEIRVQFAFEAAQVEERRKFVSDSLFEFAEYFVQVQGVGGATLRDYQLSIDLLNGSTFPPADAFEPNDDFNEAADLGDVDFRRIDNLSIVFNPIEGDFTSDDFFYFRPVQSGVLDVDVLFSHSEGNLEAELYDGGQNLIASSRSSTDNESLRALVTAGEEYFVRITTSDPGFVENRNYSLIIDAPGFPADAFEPNNSFAAASDLDVITDFFAENVNIHAAGDDDFYRFSPAQDGPIFIELNFPHELGDLDLKLFADDQTLLASSESVDDNESIFFVGSASETYTVRVYGFSGAIHPGYELIIDTPGINVDILEENDDFAAATNLGFVFTQAARTALTIDSPLDEDFFRFTAPHGGMARADLAFLHAQGNLDLEIFDAGQNLVAASASAEDGESATFPIAAGQQYFIRAFGASGAVNRRYSLFLDTTVGIPPDAFETNDSFDDASDLGFVRSEVLNLSLDTPDDEDFFRFTPDGDVGSFRVELLFDPAQGDANLLLFNSDRELIFSTKREGWYVDDVRVFATGIHELTLEAGELLRDIDFGNQSLLGVMGAGQDRKISGRLFHDFNRNRLRDPGEPGLQGYQVWLDYNANGQVDANETLISAEDDPNTPDDESGFYEFTGLASGTYNIQLLAEELTQTFPVVNEFTPGDRLIVGGPQAVQAADLNGDGVPDVVVPDSGGANITVFFSGPDGRLSSTGTPFAAAPLNQQPVPVFVEAADVDGADGLDLIVANFRGKNVALLENNGQGGFQPFRVILDLNSPAAGVLQNFHPTAIVAGRFNDDQHVDLAVVLRAPNFVNAGRVALLLGDGQGNFTLAESHEVGVAPESIAAGHFNDDNGDGVVNAADRLDLAVANLGVGMGGVSVLLNQGSGASRFMLAQTVPLAEGVFSIVAGDVTGDGFADLAAANATGRTITVLANNGAGAFAPHEEPLQPGLVTGLRLIDVDDDGDLDLAASTGFDQQNGALLRPDVKIFRNPGNGDFPTIAGQGFGVGSLQTSNLFTLAGGDVNNDRAVDFVVANLDRGELVVLEGSLHPRAHQVRLAAPAVDNVNFGVALPNPAPTLAAIPTAAPIPEDSPEQSIPLSGIGDDVEGPLQITAAANDPSFFSLLAVDYTSPNDAGVLRYRVAADRNGAATITVTVRDAGADGVPGNIDDASTSRTVTVTVEAVNDPPALAPLPGGYEVLAGISLQSIPLTGITAGGGESQTLEVSAAADDPDLFAELFVEYVSPSTTGALRLRPAAGVSGQTTIRVTVRDAGLDNVLGTADDATVVRAMPTTVLPNTSSRDPHDVDGDGDVDLADLLTLVQHARSVGLPQPIPDVPVVAPIDLDADRNGLFTINDLLVVVQTLRAQVQAQGASEGESPASWLELDDSLNLIALDVHRALK